jgi:pyruvate,water dikinase
MGGEFSIMALIFKLGAKTHRGEIGNKARNLLFLKRKGYIIPNTYVLPFFIFDKFKSEPEKIINKLRLELSHILLDGTGYAIRSSANVEDSTEASFAGQFESYLDVVSADMVIQRIKDIWDSIASYSALEYTKKINGIEKPFKMAVIIQEMVESDFAGVAFSKNPMTGMDEIIIEALEGSAIQMTQSGVTPMRWVRKWGIYTEKPVTNIIPDSCIEDISKKTKSIEKKYGNPIDIEWAFSNGLLYILQVRKITVLDIPIYSNKISREMLPGLIKPLVWSVNTSIINPKWCDILHSMVGGKRIIPHELTGYFYHRAYFNMTVFRDIFIQLGIPGEALELLMGLDIEGPEKPKFSPGIKTLLVLPRLLIFVLKLFFIVGKADKFISRSIEKYKQLFPDNMESYSNEQLLDIAQSISGHSMDVAHFNIFIPLLSSFISRILTSKFRKNDIVFDYDYSLFGNEKIYKGPMNSIADMNELLFTDNGIISYEGFLNHPLYKQFILSFGHFSDSGNDFSYVPWRETPETVYEMVRNFNSEAGAKQNSNLIIEKNLLGKKPFLRFIYKLAGRLEYYRENISSIYTYVYGAHRPIFLELGQRMASNGNIEKRDDVFFLYIDELRESILTENYNKLSFLINDRKTSVNNAKNIPVPSTIYGNTAPPLDINIGNKLTGVPTSHGFYKGIARILHGINEIDKLKSGEILVIPYSDVGWTPLFSKAGAVIAESGGILSHSSIVAREYGIPAVVSVENACMIADGSIISVNGYTGEISIITGEEGGFQ